MLVINQRKKSLIRSYPYFQSTTEIDSYISLKVKVLRYPENYPKIELGLIQ